MRSQTANRRPMRRVAREAVAFQPDAVAVDMLAPPPAARLAVYAILATLAFAGTFFWLGRVDRVVNASGALVTLAPPIVIQPLETAVIRSLAVRPGDVVRKGDLLATLDPTFTDADLARLTRRRDYLAALTARLEAELEDRFLAAPGPEAGPEAAAQHALYRQRQEEYRARLAAGETAAAALEEALASNEKERDRLREQFDLAGEVEGMYRKVWGGSYASRLEYLSALKEKLRIQDLFAQTAEKSAQYRERLAQARAENQAFIGAWRSRTAGELAKARQQAAETAHELEKASRLSELVELRAPSDAVVKDMARASEGAVARQAETLFALTPVDGRDGALEVEAAIAANDIGHVREGAAVRLKLSAYPFQRWGFLDGEVRMISPDAFMPDESGRGVLGVRPGGEVFYKARIRLISSRPERAGPDFRLLPGMTLEAEILAGSRRIAEYLLDPLLRGLHEAASEP